MSPDISFEPRGGANTASSESFPSGLVGPMNKIAKPWLTEKDQEDIQKVNNDAERRRARAAIVSALRNRQADANEPEAPEPSQALGLHVEE